MKVYVLLASLISISIFANQPTYEDFLESANLHYGALCGLCANLEIHNKGICKIYLDMLSQGGIASFGQDPEAVKFSKKLIKEVDNIQKKIEDNKLSPELGLEKITKAVKKKLKNCCPKSSLHLLATNKQEINDEEFDEALLKQNKDIDPRQCSKCLKGFILARLHFMKK